MKNYSRKFASFLGMHAIRRCGNATTRMLICALLIAAAFVELGLARPATAGPDKPSINGSAATFKGDQHLGITSTAFTPTTGADFSTQTIFSKAMEASATKAATKVEPSRTRQGAKAAPAAAESCTSKPPRDRSRTTGATVSASLRIAPGVSEATAATAETAAAGESKSSTTEISPPKAWIRTPFSPRAWAAEEVPASSARTAVSTVQSSDD